MARECRESHNLRPIGRSHRIVGARFDCKWPFASNALERVVGIVTIDGVFPHHSDFQRAAWRRLLLAADRGRVVSQQIAVGSEGSQCCSLLSTSIRVTFFPRLEIETFA